MLLRIVNEFAVVIERPEYLVSFKIDNKEFGEITVTGFVDRFEVIREFSVLGPTDWIKAFNPEGLARTLPAIFPEVSPGSPLQFQLKRFVVQYPTRSVLRIN